MADDSKKRLLFGEMCVKQGLLTDDKVEIALKEQQTGKTRIGETLVNLGFISSEDMLKTLSSQTGIKYLQFSEFPKVLLENISVSIKFMKQYKAVPIGKENGVIKVAMADPLDLYAVNALQLFFNSDILIYLSSAKDIAEAIEKYFGGNVQMTSIMEGMREEAGTIEAGGDEDVHHLRDMALEEPIIQLVNMLITHAVEGRASDIHIEPFENKLRVRYRIDGVLVEAESFPKRLQSAVISRVKIMSKLNIAERRLPQDGRIKLRVAGRDIDLRVATIPTLYGESVVMRILDKSGVLANLEDLGFPAETLNQYKNLIEMPYGMILVTGPTGSGKTTTLYASLNRINSSDRKIITIEDPVEYEIEGINQIQVKPKIGLTFAAGLRHIVRQDPDIIMIGEIRDRETAEIAIHSALTGHLVFSTLHTNDAPGAITRLLDMNIEAFLIASSLVGVLAQRLVRVICPKCKRPFTNKIFDETNLPDVTFTTYHGEGCDGCRNIGYVGRTGIFELMTVNDQIKKLVTEKVSADAVRQKAITQGMQTLRESGLSKIKSGITTLEEIIRVTQAESL
ncbi:MAG: type II secretion system protein GspE [Nitrospira bacterium HGW-Nitrospira-1]|nr:MAG: type II secretion system protein GspE [Nitrospira bacterium HGW-Nitrospira-1]